MGDPDFRAGLLGGWFFEPFAYRDDWGVRGEVEAKGVPVG